MQKVATQLPQPNLISSRHTEVENSAENDPSHHFIIRQFHL